jgi:DNA ligase (NAD+)
MDVEHLGEAAVAHLVDRGLVRDVADLYALTPAQVEQLPGFAAKSARNLTDAIASSRGRGLARLLAGLSIRHVGEHVARLLARHFRSLRRVADASVEELGAVPGVGPEIAESVAKFFVDPSNRRVSTRLEAASVVTVDREARQAGPAGPLRGKTFVLTGTLGGWSRDAARARIEELGGRVTDGVSRKTDYVVVGAEPGSKVEAARRLGVARLDEAAFGRMVRA